MTRQIAAVPMAPLAAYGIAVARQQTPLGPEWAVKADNMVYDESGRLAIRKGWVLQNATPIAGSPNIVSMHEHLSTGGTSTVISATDTKLFSGLGTPTDITGAVVFATGKWQFMNFNGNCIGVQQSQTPIKWTGAGNFAVCTAASGSLPTGNCGVAAFGRLWIADSDRQTIKYCALLDDTKWATVDGGGTIDMRNVWTQGMDEIVHITSYGGSLIVFGKRHIVLWTDGAGAALGLNPTNIYVQSVIEGAGALARDVVARVGELDIVFWSASGIRTLRRTLQEQASPMNDVTPFNRDYLTAYAKVGDLSKCKIGYSLTEGFVLLTHPDATRTFCVDIRQALPDGGFRLTEWYNFSPTALVATVTNEFYFGFNGRIGKYAGYSDNTAAFRWEYESGWLALEPLIALKMLKRLRLLLYTPANTTITLKWWTDFKNNLRTIQRPLLGGTAAEYSISEYSLAEYSGSFAFRDASFALSGSCQYVKIGLSGTGAGQPIALQSATLFYEPTRYI